MIMTTLQTPPEQTPKQKNWFLRHPVWTFILILAAIVVVFAGIAEPAPEPAAIREPDAEPVAPEPEPAPEPDTDVDDGPAAEPAPEPVEDEVDVSPMLAIGDAAELGPEFEDTTHTITVSEMRRTAKPYDAEYGSGPKRDVFLIFTVRVDADATADVYEDDFYLITNDGERVDHMDGNAMEAIDYDDGLGWVELDAGQHQQGLLAFDSPVKHGTLAYNPNYEGDPIATWKF